MREVKRGVNTYWLDKPLRTSVQQRHTVTLEGGDRALRYRLYVGYNHTPGVMKGSKRDVTTGALDLQYRFNKVLLKIRSRWKIPWEMSRLGEVLASTRN